MMEEVFVFLVVLIVLCGLFCTAAAISWIVQKVLGIYDE